MGYDGPIIDIDVHHTWASVNDLLPYMSARGREHLEDYRSANGDFGKTGGPRETASLAMSPLMTYPHTHGTNKRLDAIPADGAPAGSDYTMLKEQLLDPFKIERVILGYDIGYTSALPNPYLASDVVRAENRWTTEAWLERGDDRLYGTVLVAPELPEEAAAEIRRAGSHPKMVEVRLVANAYGKPFGHPVYEPIFRAASEMGLPVGIHFGGEFAYGTAQISAGGVPGSRLEFHTTATQTMMHHAVSLITHGMFERLPELKVVLIEGGVTWLPWIFWNLDANYDLLKRESPWVKRAPTEYLRRHVRLSTQPLDDPRKAEQLREFLETFDGLDDLLIFATDYPHWDADDPLYVTRRLPEAWLPKVMYQNGLDVYWPKS